MLDYGMGAGEKKPIRYLEGMRDGMIGDQNDRTAKARVVRFGNREIVTEGLQLSFWADISHVGDGQDRRRA